MTSKSGALSRLMPVIAAALLLPTAGTAGTRASGAVQAAGGMAISRPSGGEVFHIGDTMHITISSTVYHKAVLSILIDVYTFNLFPPFNIVANSTIDTSFIIPKSFAAPQYDSAADSIISVPVSPVWPTCKLKLWDYSVPATSALSNGAFAIVSNDAIRRVANPKCPGSGPDRSAHRVVVLANEWSPYNRTGLTDGIICAANGEIIRPSPAATTGSCRTANGCIFFVKRFR